MTTNDPVHSGDHVPKTVTPEPAFELVVHCSQTDVSDEQLDELATIVNDPSLDWNRVRQIARHNQVSSLVYDRLRSHCPESVPEAVLETFHDHFRGNAIRNRYLVTELVDILDRFESRGIRAIPYKGPILASQSYAGLSLREFEDLDVLVDEHDIEGAVTVLEELGYEWTEEPLRRRHAVLDGGAFVPPLTYEWRYRSRRDGIEVELKKRLYKPSAPIDLDFSSLWKRGVRVSLSGVEITALSPIDRLLVLAHHAFKHRWRQLKWITDVVETIRTGDPFAWDHVLSRARRARVERRLLVALGLATALFDVPADRAIRERIRAHNRVERLVTRVLDRYRNDPCSVPRWRSSHLYHVYGTDTVGDAAVAATAPFRPDLNDYRFMSLPGWLFPCYYLVRPIRVVPNLGRTAIARLSDGGR